MYRRNYLYISDAEQAIISSLNIVIVGVGLGSNIAECALRLGFCNITIIDGDKVELSNLNRQNYFHEAIGHFTVNALDARLFRKIGSDHV